MTVKQNGWSSHERILHCESSRRIGKKTRIWSATKSVVCSPCFLSSGSFTSWCSHKSEQQRKVTKVPCFWPQDLKEALQGHEMYQADYDEGERRKEIPLICSITQKCTPKLCMTASDLSIIKTLKTELPKDLWPDPDCHWVVHMWDRSE